MRSLFEQLRSHLVFDAFVALALVAAACSSDTLTNTHPDGPLELSFGPEQHLGHADGNPSTPFLRVAPDGRLFAVWTEDDSRVKAEGRESAQHQHEPGMKRDPSPSRAVMIASSAAGGQTWTRPERVNATIEAAEGEEGGPRIAFTADGKPNVVWSVPNEKGDKTRANIRFAAGDGKGGFTPARTLNETKDTARFPIIEAMPDNSLLVGWIDRRVDNPTPRSLYLMRLAAGGRQLGTSYKIGEGQCECCRLGLAVSDEGTVYMADRQVGKDQVRDHVVRKSIDGGRTFGEPVKISDDGWQVGACPHSGPTLGQDKRGHLHVTWFTLGRSENEAGIYYAASKDGGRSFAPRQLVHANTAPEILHTTLAVAPDGKVFFAWDNLDRSGKAQIFARSLEPDEQRWSPVQQISTAAGNASRPIIAVAGDRLHVAWTETQGERSWVVLRTAAIRK